MRSGGIDGIADGDLCDLARARHRLDDQARLSVRLPLHLPATHEVGQWYPSKADPCSAKEPVSQIYPKKDQYTGGGRTRIRLAA